MTANPYRGRTVSFVESADDDLIAAVCADMVDDWRAMVDEFGDSWDGSFVTWLLDQWRDLVEERLADLAVTG